MTKNKTIDELPLFDISDFLLTGEDVSEYLRQVIADRDVDELVDAMRYIDRSVGMAEITKATGMTSADLLAAMPKMAEIHPGEILHKEFMKPRRITARKMSLTISLTAIQIIEITSGRQPITPEISLQLGKFFSMNPSFWMNLQSEYDRRISSTVLEQEPYRAINTQDIRTSSDPDLAGSYDAMLRAARSAEDLAIQTNTSVLVSIDGKDVDLTASDLISRRKQETDTIEKSKGNVYADLKFPDADQMLRKAYLVSKISELILSKRLNEDEVASLLGISKTNLSKILKGQFRGVSEEELSSHLKQVQKARAC